FWFWDKSNGTDKVTVVFEGDNIVPKFQNPIPCGELKLAVGATLTAPEGLTVTTDAEGYIVAYKNGAYVAMPPVAKIGETGYATLADAINAATAGQTITLNGNVTENVTINKNLTIDGNGKTYTGTMTVNNVTVTIDNVNFVKGQVYKNKNTGSNAKITIKNCDFDGQGLDAYAINLGGTNAIVIEDCTANGYGYGLLQVPSSCAGLTIKNVEVSDVYYGFKVDYANAVTMENVKITDTTIGIYDSNYGDKTYTIKDCVLNAESPIKIWERSAAKTTTFKFVGANEATNLPSTSQYAKYVLAEAGATLTAPEGLTVTTSVNNATVEYKNGAYTVFKFLDGKGTEEDPILIGSAEDLIKFRNSVNAGEDRYNAEGKYVVLTADIDMTGIDWSVNIGDDCNATFDGIFDGKNHTISNLTSTETAQKADGYVCTGLFGAIAGNAVVKNLTIANASIDTRDFTGNNAAAVVGFAYKATGSIENVKVIGSTINAKKIDGTGAIVGYAYGGALTVKDCVVENGGVTGQAYVGGVIGYADAKANLSGNTVQNLTVDATSCAVGGVAGIMLNGGVASDNTVKNVTMTAAHENWQNAIGVVAGTFTGSVTVKNTTAEGNNVNDIVGALHAKKPTAPLPKAEAAVNDTYYGTFEAALEAAKAGDTITLLVPVVVAAGETLELNKAVTIAYTSDVINESMFNNKGTMIVDGATLRYIYTGEGDTAFTKGNYTIRNEGTLIVKSGSVENMSEQAVHCNQAIFQYSGSTTINGGTISTPAYRSVRLWKGEMVINGGNFVGQVWVQAVDNTSDLTINGGTFAPAGNDASSVFVSNATYDVEFAVTGGTYIGKIGCNDAAKLAGTVTGGTFTEIAMNGTTTTLLAENLMFKADGNGTYGIAGVVAKIGETGYATLADAIKAATAGQTITLNADVNENVTINRNLTIDGKDNNYTGTMTVNNVTVTIDNVNFVKGQVYKNKNTGSNAKITIKNCDFDGQGLNAYAINLGGTNGITIENCTAKDYGYGLLQVPSSCAALTIKDVTVSGCYYGFKVDYANAVTMENVTITDTNIGIYDSNYGAKTYTIKDCVLNATNPIKIWERSAAQTTTFKFEGENEATNLPSTSQYAKYVLAAGASLAAPEGLEFTTADGYDVLYADGVYRSMQRV
ncbi:MAG: right-handed parallel beta-helix repeat-containing protein, partial [Oscillospiraceae bacterium]|nr:right-handed parallel beta-helix repeat-containing protein [Oscillospiraceae bacterium]